MADETWRHVPATDAKYVYSPAHTPVQTVEPGETFTVDTLDCFTGRYTDPANFSPETSAWVEENLNPVTGPIAVRGARVGDVVEISIIDIELTGPALVVVSRCQAPSPADWWGEEDHVMALAVIDGEIRVGDDIAVRSKPLVGCVGVAPARETILSRREGDDFGGNLDASMIGPGATLTLPVNVDGAFLYFGDAKAAIGHGEVVCAPEIGTRITASAVVRPKPPGMRVPRVRSGSVLTCVASDIDLAQACRRAFADLLVWFGDELDLDRFTAAALLGMIGHCGVAQVSNHLHTGTASVDLTDVLVRSAR